MFTLIAQVLVNNIDNIARVWVDELRRTERTESHNHMLTAEIVNGLKSMLSSVAEAIQAQEAPDNETIPAAPYFSPILLLAHSRTDRFRRIKK